MESEETSFPYCLANIDILFGQVASFDSWYSWTIGTYGAVTQPVLSTGHAKVVLIEDFQTSMSLLSVIISSIRIFPSANLTFCNCIWYICQCFIHFTALPKRRLFKWSPFNEYCRFIDAKYEEIMNILWMLWIWILDWQYSSHDAFPFLPQNINSQHYGRSTRRDYILNLLRQIMQHIQQIILYMVLEYGDDENIAAIRCLDATSLNICTAPFLQWHSHNSDDNHDSKVYYWSEEHLCVVF